jgi:hypothetical protein
LKKTHGIEVSILIPAWAMHLKCGLVFLSRLYMSGTDCLSNRYLSSVFLV